MSEPGRSSGPADDSFERAYTAGILDEDPVSPQAARPRRPAAAPFALRGCVLTPGGALQDGHVVVDGGQIVAVQQQAPSGLARVIETGGVILPGLIDLHGHPEYNVFSAWEPPRRYANRNQWRRSQEYAQVVKEPWSRLTTPPSLLNTLTRYAEARALVGGVTAIQGASGKYPGKEEALVRNVDLRIFGEHRARSMIDLGRSDEAERRRLRQQIDTGAVTAFYVHLAEGNDETSRKEFTALVKANLLTPATVIIHGAALTANQLGQVRDAGAKLVWSPQSNLRLYGQTTLAAQALALGVPVGLGADWLPSGSPSLLAELKIARRTLARQGATVSARTLVEMVTTGAARIAGLEEHLGVLVPGRPADILVLERRRADPWDNVVEADPSWVELVTIGGDLAYGRRDWIEQLAVPGPLEDVLAWGKPLVLDTSYVAQPVAGTPLRLTDLRAALLARYVQTGPIFA
jgi:5-methylthioadenosine/S-adenosylhomocysteine deaminase